MSTAAQRQRINEPIWVQDGRTLWANKPRTGFVGTCGQCGYRSRANKDGDAVRERLVAHRCKDETGAVRKSDGSTSTEKAHRYLLEGRVKVLEVGPGVIRGEVTGSSYVPYTVAYNLVGWACNCPAQVPQCAHIVAMQLVTAPSDGALTVPALQEDELSRLLGPRWVQRSAVDTSS